MKVRLLIIVLGLAVLAPVSRSTDSPFCAGAMHAQQQPPRPPMPPPGNPDHVAPHKDAYCDRSKQVAHECKCHAKCVEDENGTIRIVEDPQCRGWCFKKHCRCPAECE